MFSNQNKLDIISILKDYFPTINVSSIISVNRIPYGSDAQIFSFEVLFDLKSVKFLLKLFRNRLPPERAENEYINLCNIFNSTVRVPKPYGFLKNTCSFKRPFMIMEFIEGEILSRTLYSNFVSTNPLLNKFVENLIIIHQNPFKTSFDRLIEPDIKNDPAIIIKSIINRTKPLVSHYNIKEFFPIIEWLENNLLNNYYCKELVLCHGDYHPNNIIVNKKAELVTLDWSNVAWSDRRIDLAFTIVVIDAELQSRVDDFIISLYEQKTKIVIGDLSYFKVLTHLFNFLRIFSTATDYTITQETDDTKRSFLNEYKKYCCEVLKLMKEISHFDFPTIEKFLQ